jgi:hypothetical protein
LLQVWKVVSIDHESEQHQVQREAIQSVKFVWDTLLHPRFQVNSSLSESIVKQTVSSDQIAVQHFQMLVYADIYVDLSLCLAEYFDLDF